MSSSPVRETAPPRAIVIGHGEFATGMRSAVQKITGRGDALIALTGAELSLAQIEDHLRQQLRSSGVTVIFTDLQAGSATMAARKVQRDTPSVVLVVGANLAVLLDFVLNTTSATAGEAAAHAADRGRAAIVVHGATAGR
jgi:PTS system N-acetylgalactosamine-specific IIA component